MGELGGRKARADGGAGGERLGIALGAEHFAKTCHGAAHALACRLFGDAQRGGDLFEGAVLVETQQNGRAIRGGEVIDRGIELDAPARSRIRAGD